MAYTPSFQLGSGADAPIHGKPEGYGWLSTWFATASARGPVDTQHEYNKGTYPAYPEYRPNSGGAEIIRVDRTFASQVHTCVTHRLVNADNRKLPSMP